MKWSISSLARNFARGGKQIIIRIFKCENFGPGHSNSIKSVECQIFRQSSFLGSAQIFSIFGASTREFSGKSANQQVNPAKTLNWPPSWEGETILRKGVGTYILNEVKDQLLTSLPLMSYAGET
jgi:hypothetical protein